MWWTCCCPTECFSIWEVCPGQEEQNPVLWLNANATCCDDPEPPCDPIGTVRKLDEGLGDTFCYELVEYARATRGSQGFFPSAESYVDCDDCLGPTDQACCIINGTCLDLPAADCLARGGVPQGPGTDCISTVCPDIDCSNMVEEGGCPSSYLVTFEGALALIVTDSEGNVCCAGSESNLSVVCTQASPGASLYESDPQPWGTENGSNCDPFRDSTWHIQLLCGASGTRWTVTVDYAIYCSANDGGSGSIRWISPAPSARCANSPPAYTELQTCSCSGFCQIVACPTGLTVT